jgi:oxalate decarboxylase/phosphoglucose isomerase-like protein (cupin superfamily)
VLEGELTLAEERDGTVVCTSTLAAGDTIFVPPWTVHGTLNLCGDGRWITAESQRREI